MAVWKERMRIMRTMTDMVYANIDMASAEVGEIERFGWRLGDSITDCRSDDAVRETPFDERELAIVRQMDRLALIPWPNENP